MPKYDIIQTQRNLNFFKKELVYDKNRYEKAR